MYKKRILYLMFLAVLALMLNIGCASKEIVEEDETTQDVSLLDNQNVSDADDYVEEPDIRDKNFEKQSALRTIYFDYNRSELSESARKVLEENAKWMKDHSQYKIVIEGHADERGTIEYNFGLAQERASMVRSYLVYLGIDPRRIGTISYGEEKPATQGHDELSWSKNRRAELLSFN